MLKTLIVNHKVKIACVGCSHKSVQTIGKLIEKPKFNLACRKCRTSYAISTHKLKPTLEAFFDELDKIHTYGQGIRRAMKKLSS